MTAQIMRGRDAIAGALAQCYVTIDGERINFMQMYAFKSEIEKTKSEVPILGKTGKASKSTGWKGTFSGTAHYNQSEFRKLLKRYKDTGEDIYFEIQVTNEDPSSSVGRQTVIHKECNLDGGVLAMYDADAEFLDEEISGTFDDFEIPETFTLLDGMK